MRTRARALLLALLVGLLATPALPASPANAEQAAPSVVIGSDATSYSYATTALFQARVSGAKQGDQLIIRVTFPNGKSSDTGPSTISGQVHEVQYPAYLNATVTALVYDEEFTEVLASASAPLRVRAGLRTYPREFRAQSGGAFLFARGSSPKFRSTLALVVPVKRCLRHVVQRSTASGWKTVFTSACRPADSKGRVDWNWAGKHASGVRFRVYATLTADRYNIATRGPATAFRFR